MVVRKRPARCRHKRNVLCTTLTPSGRQDLLLLLYDAVQKRIERGKEKIQRFLFIVIVSRLVSGDKRRSGTSEGLRRGILFF